MSSVERDVDVSLDEDENAGVATITERREIRIDDLFANGELRLWEDDHGWSGFLLEDGVYYDVNYGTHARVPWLRKVRVGEKAVREGIRQHIADPDAGGAGKFVRRCSPP